MILNLDVDLNFNFSCTFSKNCTRVYQPFRSLCLLWNFVQLEFHLDVLEVLWCSMVVGLKFHWQRYDNCFINGGDIWCRIYSLVSVSNFPSMGGNIFVEENKTFRLSPSWSWWSKSRSLQINELELANELDLLNVLELTNVSELANELDLANEPEDLAPMSRGL